jgi:hypothetical protein
MKSAREPPHKARIFWEKARRYAQAAHANRAAGLPDPTVSCAVNAVINLVDALCVLHAGARSAGGSHHDALRHLHALASLDAGVRAGVGRRLSALLSVKSLAQYEGELVSARDAERAVEDMDRAFAAAAGVAQAQGWT